MFEPAYNDNAPHMLCQFIYELSDAFNRFYHENKIMAQEDKKKQTSWITLLLLVENILELCIDLLGFRAPDKM